MMNEKIANVFYGAAGVILGLGIGYLIGSEKMRKNALAKIKSTKEKLFGGTPSAEGTEPTATEPDEEATNKQDEVTE